MTNDYRELLWQCLIESDMTQYRLAHLSGVGPCTLNRILNGRRPPTELQVIRLALAMLLNGCQKQALNRHLDSAEFYILPVEEDGDDGTAGILLPRN